MPIGKIVFDIPSKLNSGVQLDLEGEPKGNLNVKILNKEYNEPLTTDEVTVLLGIVSRASKGALKLDNAPPDLLVEWKGALERLKEQASEDVKTLESQTQRIDQLERDLELEKRAGENARNRIEELINELREERKPKPALSTIETVTTPKTEEKKSEEKKPEEKKG